MPYPNLEGLLSEQTIQAIARDLIRGDVHSAQLGAEEMQEEFAPFPEIPALWTGYDSTTGRCAWSEQEYHPATGRRQDKVLGRFGTFLSQPAYPVGNGLLPPPDFEEGLGVEVWLRWRCFTPELGNIWEFDWFCACEQGESGGTGGGGNPFPPTLPGGGGGGGDELGCCDLVEGDTLDFEFSAPGCALDGITGTITFGQHDAEAQFGVDCTNGTYFPPTDKNGSTIVDISGVCTDCGLGATVDKLLVLIACCDETIPGENAVLAGFDVGRVVGGVFQPCPETEAIGSTIDRSCDPFQYVEVRKSWEATGSDCCGVDVTLTLTKSS